MRAAASSANPNNLPLFLDLVTVTKAPEWLDAKELPLFATQLEF